MIWNIDVVQDIRSVISMKSIMKVLLSFFQCVWHFSVSIHISFGKNLFNPNAYCWNNMTQVAKM